MSESGKDLKSRLGYYAERCTAVVLCDNLKSNGFILTNETLLKELTIEKQRYLNEKILKDFKIEDIKQSLNIAETNANALGEKLYNEIASGEDSAICKYSFNVRLTGEEMKFQSKADLIVTKLDKTTTVKEIFASLKSYTSWKINLVNATFISFIKKLLFPSIEGKGLSFIDNLLISIDKNNISPEAKKILSRMKGIAGLASDFVKHKEMLKKQGDVDYRKKATKLMNEPMDGGRSRFQLIGDFVIELFNAMYKTNKDEINKNFLKIVDLDADDMYIAVASKNKTSIINTKSSKKFQSLVDNLKNSFYIEMVKVLDKAMFKLLIKAQDGSTLMVFDIPLKEEGKVNLWLNFKEFFKKD